MTDVIWLQILVINLSLDEFEEVREGRAEDRVEHLAYLAQPFACAEPETGWPGVSVPADRTHRDVARILDGELDGTPIDDLRFAGAL